MRFLWTGILIVASSALGQVNPNDVSISSATVLDAAGPKQRIAIRAVYLIGCKTMNGVGTGFLLTVGVLVTNAHVVGTCPTNDLVGVAPNNSRISFAKDVRDQDRDLALLKPSSALEGGLELADDKDPEPGTGVSTWGYPLLYNGIQPLLSVGYVAGFRDEIKGSTTTKHLIVNGAFNHGNSGGPLMVAQDNRVIGVVVLTYRFFPSYVEEGIKALQSPSGGFFSGRFSRTVDGKVEQLSDQQVSGLILGEFYEKTQVMIGEAISVAEVRKYLKANAKTLEIDLANLDRKTKASK